MNIQLEFVFIQTFFCLIRYFDACAELNQESGSTLELGDGLKPIDFKVNSKLNFQFILYEIYECF